MTRNRVICQAEQAFWWQHDPVPGCMIKRMTLHALAIAEVADRTGVELERLRSMVRRGTFPEPDVIIGADSARPVRGWTAETIEEWSRRSTD